MIIIPETIGGLSLILLHIDNMMIIIIITHHHNIKTIDQAISAWMVSIMSAIIRPTNPTTMISIIMIGITILIVLRRLTILITVAIIPMGTVITDTTDGTSSRATIIIVIPTIAANTVSTKNIVNTLVGV
jgi:hypothetical protein